MTVVGTLVFSAVFVTSIVCYTADGHHSHVSTIPVTKLYHFEEKTYNGIYYRDDNFKLTGLKGPVTFVARGNTIVGRDVGGVILPMFDQQGNMIVVESGVKKQITNQRQYGINEPYIPPSDSKLERSESSPSDFRMRLSPTPERRLEWSPTPDIRMGFSPTPERPLEWSPTPDIRMGFSPTPERPLEWSPTPEFRLHRSRSPTRQLRY